MSQLSGSPKRAERIKTVALEAGTDVAGIAAAGAWDNYAPEGRRTVDFYPRQKAWSSSAHAAQAPARGDVLIIA